MWEQKEEEEEEAKEKEVKVVELQVEQVYEKEEEEEVEVQEEHLWKEELEADDNRDDFLLSSRLSGLEWKFRNN